MNALTLKTTVSLVAMLVLLLLALVVKDVIFSKLAASMAIIIGAITTNNLLTHKKIKQ
jgi:hypothetical protein